MNRLLLLLCLMSLLDSTLTSLPAPVNLSVKSVNFHHVLRWDPGPGTPPGTEYRVYKTISGGRKTKRLAKTKRTSVQLVLKESEERHFLIVRASYNHTLSPPSARKVFTPFSDTKIGAPKLSLAGFGTSILINISLPEPDRNSFVGDIHSLYKPIYKVLVERRNNKVKTSFETGNGSYNLSNLQKGEEYCIQVTPDLIVNNNSEPSPWECTFTSIVGPNRGPVVVGAVASLVIIFIVVGMASTYLLYYTGFICKLKATLPRVLIAALSRGYTLTPERTIPDHISIIQENRRRQNNPTRPKPASRHDNSEEEDEEEEEGEWLNAYMDRPTDLSSAQSSSQDSGVASGSRTLEAAEVPELEVVHEGLEEHEAKAEGAVEVCFTPEETGARDHITGEEEEEEEQQQEEEEEEEECHSSGNVDLFSITLAALAAHEEEDEPTRESPTNILRPYQQPEAPTDSETDEQTAAVVTLPAQEDFTGYEVRRAEAFSDFFKTCEGETQEEEEEEEEEEEDDDEEEEEEEEFSGYMRHT